MTAPNDSRSSLAPRINCRRFGKGLILVPFISLGIKVHERVAANHEQGPFDVLFVSGSSES